MKEKIVKGGIPFIQDRRNYFTSLSGISCDQFNTFVKNVDISKTDCYHIQILCSSEVMTAPELYAVSKALIGEPKNGYKTKTSKKNPGIELKYGGLSKDKTTRDDAYDKLSDIISQGPIVSADENDTTVGYTASGESYKFATNVTVYSSASSSSLSETISKITSSSSSSSTSTYIILAVAVIAVILIVKKKKSK